MAVQRSHTGVDLRLKAARPTEGEITGLSLLGTLDDAGALAAIECSISPAYGTHLIAATNSA
jgi:hypothetical protein